MSRSHPTRAVVFDLDGTLLDSLPRGGVVSRGGGALLQLSNRCCIRFDDVNGHHQVVGCTQLAGGDESFDQLHVLNRVANKQLSSGGVEIGGGALRKGNAL